MHLDRHDPSPDAAERANGSAAGFDEDCDFEGTTAEQTPAPDPEPQSEDTTYPIPGTE